MNKEAIFTEISQDLLVVIPINSIPLKGVQAGSYQDRFQHYVGGPLQFSNVIHNAVKSGAVYSQTGTPLDEREMRYESMLTQGELNFPLGSYLRADLGAQHFALLVSHPGVWTSLPERGDPGPAFETVLDGMEALMVSAAMLFHSARLPGTLAPYRGMMSAEGERSHVEARVRSLQTRLYPFLINLIW